MNLKSLRFALILPYVMMVILLATALGISSYWLASKNISIFSDQYMREVTARIVQSVNFHIRGSGPVLDAAFPDGAYVSDNIETEINTLRTRFWIATSMFTNPNNYVYYGNTLGQSIALKRINNEEVELRLKLDAAEHRTYYRYKDVLGLMRRTGTEKGLLEPRNRIWYTLARHTRNHVWTAVYIDFTSQDLVVTRAKRVSDFSKEFQGVVATDVSLDEIDKFISALDVGQNGRAFLVENDGRLLASNTAPSITVDQSGVSKRVGALNSGDEVIASAYSGVIKLIDSDSFKKVRKDEYNTIISEGGRTIAVSARHIVDDAGLDWLAIVAIPRDQIFTGMHKQIWIGIAIGLITVLVTILIGLRIFGRIANDVISLSKAVERVRSGDHKVDIKTRRSDEIGDLARNFIAMHKEIFSDSLTGVANRAALDSILNSYTNRLDGKPFTLLFLDLNKFKPLNDSYGHDNGDRALTEIATRLRNLLRIDDVIARLGGDEFIILSKGLIKDQDLKVLTKKIKITIEAPLTSLKNIPDGAVVQLGVAIGAAYWPEDSKSVEDLIKIADKKMYADKPKGER